METDPSRPTRVEMYIAKTDNIKVHLNANTKEILDDGVIVEESGKELKIDSDIVILATGYRSNREGLIDFYDIAPITTEIGDVKKPADIRQTTVDAFFACSTI